MACVEDEVGLKICLQSLVTRRLVLEVAIDGDTDRDGKDDGTTDGNEDDVDGLEGVDVDTAVERDVVVALAHALAVRVSDKGVDGDGVVDGVIASAVVAVADSISAAVGGAVGTSPDVEDLTGLTDDAEVPSGGGDDSEESLVDVAAGGGVHGKEGGRGGGVGEGVEGRGGLVVLTGDRDADKGAGDRFVELELEVNGVTVVVDGEGEGVSRVVGGGDELGDVGVSEGAVLAKERGVLAVLEDDGEGGVVDLGVSVLDANVPGAGAVSVDGAVAVVARVSDDGIGLVDAVGEEDVADLEFEAVVRDGGVLVGLEGELEGVDGSGQGEEKVTVLILLEGEDLGALLRELNEVVASAVVVKGVGRASCVFPSSLCECPDSKRKRKRKGKKEKSERRRRRREEYRLYPVRVRV